MKTTFRIETIEELLKGGMSVREACDKLQVHRSTLWRLCRKFQEKGAQGIEHGLKGKRSNHAKPDAFRAQVCALYFNEYETKGHTVLSFYNSVARTLPDYASYSTVLTWIRTAKTASSGDVAEAAEKRE